MYMYEHFKNIENLYGKAYVQMPNGIFRDLKTINTNIQQISFCFSYLVTVAFLYKYAHFVDIDNGTYIQNSDIKQILGYNKTTKTIDKYIKKNGVLEVMNLLETTRNYPVSAEYIKEKTNNVNMRDFKTINMLDTDSIDYKMIKSIVRNNNYNIRIPKFLFEYKGDLGTLYNYDNTFRVDLSEFMTFMYNADLDNTDFLLYCYFKSKCFGHRGNEQQIPLNRIISDVGIKKDAYYNHLNKLENEKFIEVIHKGWQVGSEEEDVEANDYCFKGVC